MTNLTDIIGPHFYGTSRPGFMQDQDQDLLVHQDQDQGLAQSYLIDIYNIELLIYLL